MSFASNAKEEIARVPCESAACALSELSAAVSAVRAAQGMNPSSYRVRLSSGSARVVQRYFNHLKNYIGITAQIETTRSEALGGRTRYHLVLAKEDVMTLLNALRLYDPEAAFGLPQVPPEEAFSSDEEKATFLRGAFLMCGTVTNPEKKYHLEFTAPNEGFANRIADIARGLQLHPSIIERRGSMIVYFKRAEEISDLLTLLGAGSAMMKLENMRIQKDVREQINRQMNCDQSNIERAVQAALAQAEDIRYLDEEIGLDRLPESIAAVARLRLEYPDASLSELGTLCTPPLGKSGVRGRMNKIALIANKLRSGEDTGLK